MSYFEVEPIQALEKAGARGFWRGYFAGRLAALEPRSAEVAVAALFGFHARMVCRAVPEIWSMVSPAAAERARREGSAAALRRLLRNVLEADIAALASCLQDSLECVEIGGRPLAAAHCSLPFPSDRYELLWHAATALREYRGDGHVAVLVALGVLPAEAHVLQVAAGRSTRAALQPNRGFSDDEWLEAIGSLHDRSAIDSAGGLTTSGANLVAEIDYLTDDRSLPLALSDMESSLFERISGAVRAGAVTPYPNPMGLPAEA